MKATYLSIAALALAAAGLTSCGSEKITYKLDEAATKLEWEGSFVSDGHKHNGTIAVTDGKVTYEGDEFKSGEFTVDMNTVNDEDMSAPDSDTLDKHLEGPYFFNAEEHPKTKVTIKSVTDKDITVKIEVVGKDIETTIPVKVTRTDDKLTAKGKFSIDFTQADMQGTKPIDPANPTMHVDPKINFELNVVMKAK